MDEGSAREIAEFMSVLGVESRLKIVAILMESGPLCVNVIACRLGISQSAVSQHLRILHMAGLVSSVRDGYYTHYSLDREKLRCGLELIEGLNEAVEAPAGSGCRKKGGEECAEVKRNAKNRKT